MSHGVLQLKKIRDQVIVISGASNEIGLATALMCAERGAKVVLSSLSENDLRDAVCRIRQRRGDAVFVVADVSKLEDIDRIAERALSEFGRIDSWINNAGISVLGKLTDIPMEEKRQLFEVNFWGVVYGCRAAVQTMKANGGAIVNVDRTQAEALLVEGICLVTKNAVKTYTDALRGELIADKIPISVRSLEVVSKNSAENILNWCESVHDSNTSSAPKSYSFIEKSAAVAATLGVAAFAAYKAVQYGRKADEVIH